MVRVWIGNAAGSGLSGGFGALVYQPALLDRSNGKTYSATSSGLEGDDMIEEYGPANDECDDADMEM